MKLSILILSALFLAAPAAAANGYAWPAITPDLWAIQASRDQDPNGAVILLERYHFHRRSMERFRRTLVLAETGKALTEFQLPGAKVTRLEGRTVSPDGQALPFLQGGDVLKTTLVSGREGEVEAVKVIPPGVSGHCIVDVHWTEPIDAEARPVPDGYDYHLLFSLSGPVRVARAEVVFDDDLADLGWRRKFEVVKGQKVKDDYRDGRTTYLFEDIPARQDVPLASQADMRTPIFSWFWPPEVRDWLIHLELPRDRTITMVDAAACTIFYAYLMENGAGSSSFISALKRLGEGTGALPPRERALALIRALRAKVRTLTELSGAPENRSGKTTPSRILERGWGTAQELTELGFHLLREHGLDVSLVMAIDRENRLLDTSNIWQYDHMVLSIRDEGGDPVYFNPGSTFGPVGLPPWLQGSNAMVVHPGKQRLDWTAKVIPLPAAAPERNAQTWRVTLTPGEDSDVYEAAFRATGNAASHWRDRLQEAHATELGRALKPAVEQQGFRLLDAPATDWSEPWKELAFTLKGALDHEGGRRRMLHPFPFLGSPIPIPSSWPETRTVAIHLPMTTLIEAEAHVPWRGEFPPAQELEPIRQENRLGRVIWLAEGVEGKEGRELVVRLTIQVSALVGTPKEYPQLKAFSGWILDALGRGLPAPRP